MWVVGVLCVGCRVLGVGWWVVGGGWWVVPNRNGSFLQSLQIAMFCLKESSHRKVSLYEGFAVSQLLKNTYFAEI